MHTRLIAFLSCLFAMLASACGACSPSPATGSPAEGASSERWIAGIPVVTRGEGFVSLHYVADGPEGPWAPEQLTSVQTADHPLQPGQVHRVRAHWESRDGIMDGPDRRLVVTELLESRPGGPPVDVFPGQSAGGILLSDVEGDGFVVGPFEVLGAPAGIRVSVDEVGAVRVGDTVYRTGEPLDAFLATLGSCERQGNRGATLYRCDGLLVTHAGPVADYNVSVTVVARAPGSDCRAADSCDACLGMAGCNWTADHCETVCLMDTSCYGPGNPSAPSCPSE